MAHNNGYNLALLFCISFSLFTCVLSQSTLQYNVFEEEQLPMDIADLLLESGLRDRYTPDIVQILTLEISEHPQNHHRFFSVTPSGMFTVSSRLDRDEICPNEQTCVINLDIKVNPTAYFAILKVDVTVLDKNDNIPSFGNEPTFVMSFAEGSVPDVPQGLPLATDPDSPSYDIGSYQLTGQGSEFSLETFNGNDGSIEPLLKINTNLDREAIPEYSFILLAIDKGSPRRTGSVTIILQVTDINDQYPVFDNALYERTIDEDEAPGTFVLAVRATDADEGENARVEYAFGSQVPQEARDVFDINAITGDITVIGILDYERQQDYSLAIVARDNGQSPLSSQTRVVIRLQDVNDNEPIIELSSAANGNRVNVQENSPPDTFVAYIRVTDPDSGVNGEFDCRLDNDDFILTQLHQNDFTLKTDSVLDREETGEYFVNVICEDNGQLKLSSSLIIEVIVSDVNDNPPLFDQDIEISILESNEVGQTLATVKATDLDIGDNGAITYSLWTSSVYHMNSFSIDPVTGDITVTGPIDHEQASEIELVVTATDQGTQPLNGVTIVRITVIDIDDEPPVFVYPDVGSDSFDFAVYEHESPNAFVDQVVAEDKDSVQYNEITYSIRNQEPEFDTDIIEEIPFRIDSVSGELYATMELDREVKSLYTFVAVATGNAPNNWQSETMVTVHVADRNDHAPSFVFPNVINNTAYLSSSVKEGAIVTDIVAEDRDENDNALLRYSMSYDARDVKFTIDETTGRITAARDFDTKQEVVVLTVYVRDSGRTPLDDTAYLNVMFSPQSSSSSKDNSNEALVIAIAVVAAVIVTILILAIVCLLRRHNRARKSGNYLKNCHEIMNANNIVNDAPAPTAQPLDNAVVMHKNNLGNHSLDSSYQSSVMDKQSLQGGGHDNRGMVYDSDRGSFVVAPWKQGHSNLHNNIQAEREKAIPEVEDTDSACSLEGSNTDSGRGSNDDCSMSRQNPPIPQRLPVNAPPQRPHSGDWVTGTRHLPPGVHNPVRSQDPRNNIRQLYPDNKQYYDERVFRNGATANRSHDRSNDFIPHPPPSYNHQNPPRSLHMVDRTHVPSPSPSLQYPPGHEPVHNIHRQQSLNLPDLPPRKSVHYCSQV